MAPRQSNPRQVVQRSVREQFHTAVHEAGHAMMAAYKGLPIEEVSIIPNLEEGRGGRVLLAIGTKERSRLFRRTRRDTPNREQVLLQVSSLIMVTLAGSVATELLLGERSGDGHDMLTVRKLLETHMREPIEAREELLETYRDVVRRHIQMPDSLQKVLELARQLMANQVLDGDVCVRLAA